MTKKRARREDPLPTPVREATVRAGEFNEVLALIEASRRRAYQAVNTELVGLYWQLGEYVSRKIESAQWGEGVVDELAAAIARRYPGLHGYTRASLFRMRQFYEAYRSNEKSHHWCDNYRGRITSSFWAEPNLRRPASSTFSPRSSSAGPSVRLNAKSAAARLFAPRLAARKCQQR